MTITKFEIDQQRRVLRLTGDYSGGTTVELPWSEPVNIADLDDQLYDNQGDGQDLAPDGELILSCIATAVAYGIRIGSGIGRAEHVDIERKPE